MTKGPTGFVPLKSLRQQPTSADAILAEIRQIYFKTTRQTIEHDFAHAIELLRSLEQEDDREKATVYMHGLAEMRNDWAEPQREKKSRPMGSPRSASNTGQTKRAQSGTKTGSVKGAPAAGVQGKPKK